MMKKVMLVCLSVLFVPTMAQASKMNLDPYFTIGATVMEAKVGSNTSASPSGYVGIGSALNWLSPHLKSEFRFGVGGQHTAFNGKVNLYASYLLKPSLALTQQWDIYALLGMTTMGVSVGTTDSSDTGLSYGLGLAYHIPNESLSIQGEWMQYHKSSDASTTSISGMDISGGSMALVFEYY